MYELYTRKNTNTNLYVLKQKTSHYANLWLYVYRILTIHINVHNNMLPTLYRVIACEYYRRIDNVLWVRYVCTKTTSLQY